MDGSVLGICFLRLGQQNILVSYLVEKLTIVLNLALKLRSITIACYVSLTST